MPRLYTARPLHVEAVQFLGDVNGAECQEFLGDDFEGFDAVGGELDFVSHSRDGLATAMPGDWIVRHPSGWFQAIPNDVFLVTYTEV